MGGGAPALRSPPSVSTTGVGGAMADSAITVFGLKTTRST